MEINREALRSSRRIRRKKIFQVFSYCCLFLVAIFALTSYLFHIDQLYIKRVYISGNKQVEDRQIFNVAKEILDGKHYGIYPKNNILIYPKKMIIKSLARDIPWIAETFISAAGNSLLIEVKEREPKYLWCDDLSKAILNRSCYYLDSNGFGFDKAPNFSSHVYPEFYGGNKRGGYTGRSILPLDSLGHVLSVKDSLEKIIKSQYSPFAHIYGVYIYNNDDYDLLITDGKKEWKIIFNLTKSLSEEKKLKIEKKLKAIISSPFFIKELNNTTQSLKYLDLRFGKKVFYKFE